MGTTQAPASVAFLWVTLGTHGRAAVADLVLHGLCEAFATDDHRLKWALVYKHQRSQRPDEWEGGGGWEVRDLACTF